jgi:predicted dehydrogenase
VQVGMQQRSAPHFQKAVKLIQDGLLGDIAYTRTWRVQNHAPDWIGMGGDPMPKGMDYNMWLGPAPKVEYNSNRCHYNWRWFYDYGCTLVGDWNVHLQDIVHWATGTYSPISVVATGGKNILKDNRDTPDTLNVSYDFQRPDGKKFVQTFTFTFCCGSPLQDHPYGIQFFSENGSMFIDRENGYESFPDTKGAHDAQGNRIRVDRMEKVSGKTDDPAYPHQAHAENFIACVRSRKREDLHVDIETGFMTAAACHLGNISYKLGGRKIWWDADKQIITHQDGTPDDEANVHLSKPQGYRAPFTLPEV